MAFASLMLWSVLMPPIATVGGVCSANPPHPRSSEGGIICCFFSIAPSLFPCTLFFVSYPISTCNAGELLTDGDFNVGDGAWTVGDRWDIPGDGTAVFDGASAVETMIKQDITIVKNHTLEIHLAVTSVFWLHPPRGFHVKIGGASSPLITAAGNFIWYLLPKTDGVQGFQITADDLPYDAPDSIFLSHVSCRDIICEIVNPDLNISQPDLYYLPREASNNKLMVKFASRFDFTKILVMHDPEWP